MKPFTFPFGKHVGKTLSEIERIDPGYLDWCLREFKGEDIKWEIKKFRNGGNAPEIDKGYINETVKKLFPLPEDIQTKLF